MVELLQALLKPHESLGNKPPILFNKQRGMRLPDFIIDRQLTEKTIFTIASRGVLHDHQFLVMAIPFLFVSQRRPEVCSQAIHADKHCCIPISTGCFQIMP